MDISQPCSSLCKQIIGGSKRPQYIITKGLCSPLEWDGLQYHVPTKIEITEGYYKPDSYITSSRLKQETQNIKTAFKRIPIKTFLYHGVYLYTGKTAFLIETHIP